MYAIWMQETNSPAALPHHYCSYTREGDALAAVVDDVAEQFDLARLYPLALDEAAAAFDVDGKIVAAWTAQVRGTVGTDMIVVVDDREPAPAPPAADTFFGQAVLMRPTENMKLLAPDKYGQERGEVVQLVMDNGTSWVTMPALDRDELLALHAALGDFIYTIRPDA